MSDVSPKLIQKIQKLLRLANHAATNENEAAMAMAAAHGLLAEYNLTMASVEEKDQTKTGHGYTEAVNKNDAQWVGVVWNGAAKLNFCQAIHENRNGAHNYMIVGTELNCLATKLMGEYLLEVVKRLAKEAFFVDADVSAAMQRHKFKQGCARRLYTRLMDLKKLRSEKPSTTVEGRNLPALMDSYTKAAQDIAAHLTSIDMELVTRKSSVKMTQAFMAGQAAAKTVGLEPQVAGHGKHVRIGR